MTRYKPDIRWQADWAGDGRYAHAASELSDWLIGFWVAYGTSIGPYSGGIEFAEASGVLRLDNEAGRFDFIGGQIAGADLAKPRRCRLVCDGEIWWTGRLQIDLEALAEDNTVAQFRLLPAAWLLYQQDVLQVSNSSDDLLTSKLQQFAQATSLDDGKEAQRLFHFLGAPAVRAGPIYFAGNWATLLGYAGRMWGGWVYEDNTGVLRVANLDQAVRSPASASFPRSDYEEVVSVKGGVIPGTLHNTATYTGQALRAPLSDDTVDGIPVQLIGTTRHAAVAGQRLTAWLELDPTPDRRLVQWAPSPVVPVNDQDALTASPAPVVRVTDNGLRVDLTPTVTQTLVLQYYGAPYAAHDSWSLRDYVPEDSDFVASVNDNGLRELVIPPWQTSDYPTFPNLSIDVQRKFLRYLYEPLVGAFHSFSMHQPTEALTDRLRDSAKPGRVVEMGGRKTLLLGVRLSGDRNHAQIETRGVDLASAASLPAVLPGFPTPGGTRVATVLCDVSVPEIDAVLCERPESCAAVGSGAQGAVQLVWDSDAYETTVAHRAARPSSSQRGGVPNERSRITEFFYDEAAFGNSGIVGAVQVPWFAGRGPATAGFSNGAHPHGRIVRWPRTVQVGFPSRRPPRVDTFSAGDETPVPSTSQNYVGPQRHELSPGAVTVDEMVTSPAAVLLVAVPGKDLPPPPLGHLSPPQNAKVYLQLGDASEWTEANMRALATGAQVIRGQTLRFGAYLSGGTTLDSRYAFYAGDDIPDGLDCDDFDLTSNPVAPVPAAQKDCKLTSFASAAEGTQVTLSWISADFETARDDFILQRKVASEEDTEYQTLTTSLADGGNTYIDSSVAASTEYVYRIGCKRKTASGYGYLFTRITTGAQTVPSAPPQVLNLRHDTLLPRNNRTTIRYTIAPNGADITSLKYTVSKDGAKAVTFNISPLTPGKVTKYSHVVQIAEGSSYTIVVTAVNSAGTGTESLTFSVTAPPPTEPPIDFEIWTTEKQADGRDIGDFTYAVDGPSVRVWLHTTNMDTYSITRNGRAFVIDRDLDSDGVTPVTLSSPASYVISATRSATDAVLTVRLTLVTRIVNEPDVEWTSDSAGKRPVSLVFVDAFPHTLYIPTTAAAQFRVITPTVANPAWSTVGAAVMTYVANNGSGTYTVEVRAFGNTEADATASVRILLRTQTTTPTVQLTEDNRGTKQAGTRYIVTASQRAALRFWAVLGGGANQWRWRTPDNRWTTWATVTGSVVAMPTIKAYGTHRVQSRKSGTTAFAQDTVYVDPPSRPDPPVTPPNTSKTPQYQIRVIWRAVASGGLTVPVLTWSYSIVVRSINVDQVTVLLEFDDLDDIKYGPVTPRNGYTATSGSGLVGVAGDTLLTHFLDFVRVTLTGDGGTVKRVFGAKRLTRENIDERPGRYSAVYESSGWE